MRAIRAKSYGNPFPLRTLIRNFDALQEEFKSTPYAKFFLEHEAEPEVRGSLGGQAVAT